MKKNGVPFDQLYRLVPPRFELDPSLIFLCPFLLFSCYKLWMNNRYYYNYNDEEDASSSSSFMENWRRGKKSRQMDRQVNINWALRTRFRLGLAASRILFYFMSQLIFFFFIAWPSRPNLFILKEWFWYLINAKFCFVVLKKKRLGMS